MEFPAGTWLRILRLFALKNTVLSIIIGNTTTTIVNCDSHEAGNI